MRGLTLIELMAAVAIITISVTFGIPSFFETLDKYRAKSEISSFEKTIRKSRWLALNLGEEISICPLSGSSCSTFWNQSLTVFSDRNRNSKLDTGEDIHFVQDRTNSRGRWKKRSNIKNIIRLTPNGYAFAYASTWIFCPQSKNWRHARQLVINLQGRVRIAPYLNKNGTPYATLKDLQCS